MFFLLAGRQLKGVTVVLHHSVLQETLVVSELPAGQADSLRLTGLEVDRRLRAPGLTQAVPASRALGPHLVIPVGKTTASHPAKEQVEAEEGWNEMRNDKR